MTERNIIQHVLDKKTVENLDGGMVRQIQIA